MGAFNAVSFFYIIFYLISNPILSTILLYFINPFLYPFPLCLSSCQHILYPGLCEIFLTGLELLIHTYFQQQIDFSQNNNKQDPTIKLSCLKFFNYFSLS